MQASAAGPADCPAHVDDVDADGAPTVAAGLVRDHGDAVRLELLTHGGLVALTDLERSRADREHAGAADEHGLQLRLAAAELDHALDQLRHGMIGELQRV